MALHAVSVGREAIVHREFCANPDVPQRVNFHALPKHPEVTVRLARMVEVLEDIACGTIQRVTPAEFDKVYPLRGGHTSPSVGQPNQNAGEFAELPSCGEVCRRE